MSYIKLNNEYNENTKTKILIFTEGTILRHKSLFSIFNYSKYVPIKNAADKINGWNKQGAEILYCTSRKRNSQISSISAVLSRYGFTGSRLYFRKEHESYKDIIETLKPDILIEDDCRSIGGARQMCITKVGQEIKNKIKSIVVKEFDGIDCLAQDYREL